MTSWELAKGILIADVARAGLGLLTLLAMLVVAVLWIAACETRDWWWRRRRLRQRKRQGRT